MRILYSHRIQSRDGQSVHVEELIAAFQSLGHEVRVVGPSFYAHSGFGGESRTVARLRRLLPGMLGEFAELAYNLPAYRKLAREAAEFKPDLIYERYNLYYLAGAMLARRTGLPYFLEVNAPLAEERSRYGGLKLQWLAHALERWVWRTASRVLPVTGVLKDMIAAADVPRDRISVVPNGVVLDRYHPAPPAEEPRLLLGFVGFVRPWHGMDTVIRAIAARDAAPDQQQLALTVIGDGPARAELEALADKLGIAARVQFTGLVDHALVPGLVGGFDIALQPRVVAYASPLKIFDYMAAGRAIVAPDQPNIREILEHERTALLFDPDAEGAMAEAVARLAGDAELRERLGAAARAELERRDFTWRGNAARIAAWAAS
jgi:glycosyltransferase involved in cell wall biosynthesis